MKNDEIMDWGEFLNTYLYLQLILEGLTSKYCTFLHSLMNQLTQPGLTQEHKKPNQVTTT